MSNREDQQRTAIIAALSGVNERANKVDLSTQELVLIEGTYPALSGQQAKLPGKALLAKFDESVYGIHQFWTPYGYGNNVYQFDGTVGVDPWITPPGGPIVIPAIPPVPPYDDTYIILDEFGNNPTYPTGGYVSGLSVTYTNSGGSSNGTTSTPGSPRPDPVPPPANFVLYYRSWIINFGGAGIQYRDSVDKLTIYTAPGGTAIAMGHANMTQEAIDEWNDTYPYATFTKAVAPTIGTAEIPISPGTNFEIYDPVMGFYVWVNNLYWNITRNVYFMNGDAPHSYQKEGYGG